MSNLHIIEVQIHKPVNDGFRVKVSVLDLGMFLNGVLVFPPNDQHEEWITYPPVIKIGYKKIYPAEFNKKETLWSEIHQACTEAVKLEQSYDTPTELDDPEDWSQEKLKRQLDKVWPDENQ
ncbi:MAG: hypothetical protein UY35_C0005G0072 [Candidatus Saccharibacteria bacterium GW2011_GWC2_48_9]|nr:MAG: hypothetical protein UY35_C0005G0072 [Candidatus Saccharibacteria bacterium GW2011_GWC2_48_9]